MLTLSRALDRSRLLPTFVVVDGSSAALLNDLPADVELVDLVCPRVRGSLMAIVRCIRARRPDVVLTTAGHLNVAVAMLRPFLPAATRLIAREAGVIADTFESQGFAWLWTLAYRALYGRFDAIICQSEQMRDELMHGFAVPRSKTCVINNPVDMARIRLRAQEPMSPDVTAAWGSAADSIRLVAAGRLANEKGFDLLLDAMARLADRRYQLVILGDGPLRGDLERQVRALELESKVHLAGFAENPFSIFAKAHAFVLSSRSEAFPNVVLEALAAGTSVICTPARGGLAELVAGKRRVHMAHDVSADALATAIRQFTPGADAGDNIVALGRHAPSAVASAYADVLCGSAGAQ